MTPSTKDIPYIDDYRTSSPENFVNPNELLDNKGNNNGGGNNMDNKYVTKEYFNAKFETIDTKIDALSKHIDDKFDQIPNIIENSILKEREFQREQQKETRRFFWGTIIIGGVSALAGVASVIISLLLH